MITILLLVLFVLYVWYMLYMRNYMKIENIFQNKFVISNDNKEFGYVISHVGHGFNVCMVDTMSYKDGIEVCYSNVLVTNNSILNFSIISNQKIYDYLKERIKDDTLIDEIIVYFETNYNKIIER